MIYCDLVVDSASIWSGVPCLNMVCIKSGGYIGFSGDLIFADTEGTSDPFYEGFDSRFVLFFFPEAGDGVEIPLIVSPSQSLSIVLDGQNCTLRIYEKSAR